MKLVGRAAAILVATACATAAAQRTAPQPVSFPRPDGRTCIVPEETLTVAAVGDVLLHETVQQWTTTQPDGLMPALKDVQALVGAADVAIANLEGPAALGVAPGGRPITPAPRTRFDKAVYAGYPLFNYHPSVVNELGRTGFRVLQTANNHALDRGSLGVDRTLDAVDSAGLQSTGTRHSLHPEAPWYTIVDVRKEGRDHRLAFLACSYGTNGMPDPGKQMLMCYGQREQVLSIVRSLRGRPDIHAVIVLPHWGVEYQDRPDAQQAALAAELAEAGATAIIGTHPHVVQPLSSLKTADGRTVAVAWSLGNFISHQVGLERLTSFVLALALAPAPGGSLEARALEWIPIRTRTTGGYSVDRVQSLPEPAARPHLDHLLRTLHADNLHPPATRYWEHRRCAPPG